MKRRNNNSLLLLFGLMLCIPLSNCAFDTTASSGTGTPCDQPSDVRGSITTISPASGNTIGSLLIDGTKEKQAQFDKVHVIVNAATQIFEKHGNQCRASAFSTLKTGQRVQVLSTGGALQSYPPQVTATAVIALIS